MGRSTADGRDNTTRSEERPHTSVTRALQGTGEGMASANHPIDKVRALQRALYVAAKQQRQRSPEANSPGFGESRASKRGGAYLQAAMNMNSAASKQATVRERAGRARALWAKAALQAVDSGAAWNRSGVREAACRESRLVNWGDPPAPVGEIDRRGSEPWYKASPKSGAVRRESEWGVVPLTAETTQLGPRKGPTLR